MTSIVRSTIVMALGLTLVLLGMTGAASAQDTYAPSAPQVAGPGPISNVPGQLSGSQAGLVGDGTFNLSDEARAFITPLIAVPAGSGGGAGGVGGTGGGQLAFTGSETSVLAAGGMSLVLAGGVALIVSRRRD